MSPPLFLKQAPFRFFLAAISGWLLALSFPNANVAGFAWVAPGLIMFCGLAATPRQRFWLGYVAGLAHFLTSLRWLLAIPFPAGAIAGWLALSAYLSLYPAVWVWVCWRLFPQQPRNVDAFVRTNWRERALWSFLSAVVWVALEMTMARLFSGFPWNFLGITQFKMVPLLQIASVTGVYGISFLLVWFGVSVCSAACLILRSPRTTRLWSSEIILPALAAASAFAFGAQKLRYETVPSRTAKLALIQPSIPQTLIFDPTQDDSRFDRLMDLSREALVQQPDVLVWPEASTPPLDAQKFQALTNLIAEHNVWMIIGSDDASIDPAPGRGFRTNYYNSSFLFKPDGSAVATYRKRRLVIFGEYIPLERWLPFMRWFTPIDGGFTAGPGPVSFGLESPRAQTSVLICFEDVFPHYAREHVDNDTDFLLNLTNDGWFGEGSAQWQQAANAFFRAIENGRPIVRCTNNGLTCWADRFGRVRDVFTDANGSIYGPGFLLAEVPLLEAPPAPTFYRRYGDVFGWSCVGLSAAALAMTFRKRRRDPALIS